MHLQLTWVPLRSILILNFMTARTHQHQQLDPAAAAQHARERLAEWIAEKGLKATRQRDVIVDTFFESPGHLSVDELLEAVMIRDPHIGAATVYRTMKILTECGLASARHFDDG